MAQCVVLLFCRTASLNVDGSYDSPYALRITRVPPTGRLLPVFTLPHVHLPIPHASEDLPRNVRGGQFLEYLRKFPLLDFLSHTCLSAP